MRTKAIARKALFGVMFIAIIAIALCLFGCGKAAEYFYDAPENIAYDGSFVTWGKCENANYYNVSIDGGENKRCNSTTYAYESDKAFEVTVTAVYEHGEKSASITFTPLEKISELFIADNGEVSWTAISGANAYSVSVNGKETTTTDTVYTPAVGSNRVKVKPIVSGDNTFYSKYCDEVSVYIYETPKSIKYDSTDITWTGNAASYEINVNGRTETVQGNTYSFKSDNRDFTVKLKALGNHSGTYDSAEVSEDFHYLSPVTDLVVEDGVIKWTAIDGAEKYKVKVDTVVQKNMVTESEYDGIASGKSHDISVMPVNESGNYFSSWSAEKTVFILDTPVTDFETSLALDGDANNNFKWNAVNAAAGYTVRITKDGTVVGTYPCTTLFYPYAYTDVAVYTIEVKANAEEGSADYYASKYSKPITVERLAAPKAAGDNYIVSDRDSLAKGFTVNFQRVNGATGYQLYKDGVLLNGKYTTSAALTDNAVADVSNMSEQNYNYTVKSIGGVRTVSGAKYVTLDCLTSAALSFDIKVQATPQNLLMSGFNLSWSAIGGANGYTVAYDGTSNTANAALLDLSTLNAGAHSVTVAARGNGGATLASAFSSPVEIQRLAYPLNIRISSEDNGTLKWDDVSNATGYSAYLGLSKDPLDQSAYSNMYQFINTDGTTLSMVADANRYNDDKTVYYMTSSASPTQQFIRLAAPVFPEGAVANSTELAWNVPVNINTAEYTPRYRLFSAIDTQITGGDVNGTKFNIEYLEGGRTHNFYVKAIGNDTKYLDSEYSEIFTCYKLATPRIAIQDGQYVWSSIANASAYYLEIDGRKASDDYHVSGSTYSYTPRYTSAGDHSVKLKATGDGRNNIDSAAFVMTQVAAILDAPVISYYYSKNAVAADGQIVAVVTGEVANCSKYQYEVAGVSVESTDTTYAKTVSTAGNYPVRVKALGGTFDANEVYYIDSQYAGGGDGYVVTLLGKPGSFSINGDGVVKWSAVSGNFGYEYEISFDGRAATANTSSYNTLDPIANFRSYHTITIRVRAKGNSTNTTVSSEWVEWTWTNSEYAG